MILTPKNWNSFQHYKDRAPAWIKLHKALLDDYEFSCLPVASRALAPVLWLLASEYEGGKIDASLDKIAFRLRMTRGELADALSPLVEKGFFDASEPLADRKQDAIPEKEREIEKEEEKEHAASAAHLVSPPEPEKAFFDQAAQILGKDGRSLAAKLLKSKKNIALAHSALLTASTKSNPREYLGAIIRGRDQEEGRHPLAF